MFTYVKHGLTTNAITVAIPWLDVYKPLVEYHIVIHVANVQ